MYKFRATIYRSALNYVIDIPKEMSTALRTGKYVHVRGSVNNKPFRGTMAPRKGGCHILFINSEIRNVTKVGENDTIDISLEYDPESREIQVPEDVELILSENEVIYHAFLNLSPSSRREYLKYILSAKREETRLKRIELIIQRMHERIERKKVRQ